MKRLRWCIVPILALTFAVVSVAQEEAAEESAPASEEAGDSAQDVMDRMSEEVQQNPLIEPTQRPDDGRGGDGRPRVDPRIIGVAPGEPAPQLRREGEFIVNRPGRLARSTDGMHMLFVFDADSRKSQEPPMILVPCQMLQDMEQIVHDRGDRMMFILSGQILVYRGANYLLPTMMKVAMDKGNLQQ